MDIKVTENGADRMKFTLSGVDPSIANSLRRAMIAEVPTMAVEKCQVYANSSPLPDEFLVHRLALVPLISTRVLHDWKDSTTQLIYTDECDCIQGCSRCQVELRLRVKNEDLEHNRTVTSMDIESRDVCEVDGGIHCVVPFDCKKHLEVDPQHAVVITKLRPLQEVDIRLIARKGIGRVHAKFSPVATAVFRYEADIRIDRDIMAKLSAKQRQAFANSCPTEVFKYHPDTQNVEVANNRECTFCNECVLVTKDFDLEHPDKYNGLVSIQEKHQIFHFTVESNGALPPAKIVSEALWVLKSKMERNLQAVKRATLGEGRDEGGMLMEGDDQMDIDG